MLGKRSEAPPRWIALEVRQSLDSALGYGRYDHIDPRVPRLAEATPFYETLLPALGFTRRVAGEGWLQFDPGGAIAEATPSWLSRAGPRTIAPMSQVTQLLSAMDRGDSKSAEQLLALVYEELRRIAATKMAHEPPGQTLQPTALVHEAWLRLGADAQPAWQNRAHFFSGAAEAMRRILVENARRKMRLKRGGGQERVALEESAIQAPAEDEKLVQVHEALDALAKEDPQKAEIVKLRFFAGLNHQEIAALLGVSEKTVRRHWELAKLRLFQRIKAAQ